MSEPRFYGLKVRCVTAHGSRTMEFEGVFDDEASAMRAAEDALRRAYPSAWHIWADVVKRGKP